MNVELLTKAESLGFYERQIALLTGTTEDAIRAERKKIGLVPSYRLVDTCAAEFEASNRDFYLLQNKKEAQRCLNSIKPADIICQ